WLSTEAPFARILSRLEAAVDSGEELAPIEAEWLRELRLRTIAIFNRAIPDAAYAARDPRRVVNARSFLGFAFSPRGAVANALGIAEKDPETAPPKSPRRKQKATA